MVEQDGHPPIRWKHMFIYCGIEDKRFYEAGSLQGKPPAVLASFVLLNYKNISFICTNHA